MKANGESQARTKEFRRTEDVLAGLASRGLARSAALSFGEPAERRSTKPTSIFSTNLQTQCNALKLSQNLLSELLDELQIGLWVGLAHGALRRLQRQNLQLQTAIRLAQRATLRLGLSVEAKSSNEIIVYLRTVSRQWHFQ